MLGFSQLLKIYKLICRYILIKDYIEMAQGFIMNLLFKFFIREKMACHTLIGELWDGILFLFKPTPHVVNIFH